MNLLQKRGARALLAEANASTVTRPQPARAAATARSTAAQTASSMAGPSTAATLASGPSSEPSRDAQSTPSWIRMRPGT